MKLRKALIFLLCVVLALPLAACSKDGTSDRGGPGGEIVDTGKEYKVTFDIGDEARAAGIFEPADQKVKGGGVIGYFPTPQNFGDYTFGGWFDGKDQFLATTKVTRNWSLKAKWNDNSALREEAEKYEANISSWDQEGHLYIHYKRAGHSDSDVGKKYNGNGPEYDEPAKAINDSAVYSDWGLWLWPTNGETEYNGTEYSYEGILFYPSKIDESGAVYDILLNRTYAKGGWDENTLTHKGLNVNYVNQSNGVLRDMKMQLFRVSSRAEQGFWKNDGGNVTLSNSKMIREKGSYHWFVSEGRVGSGTPKFTAEEIRDVYADDPDRTKHPTDKSLDNELNINSNKSNKSTYNINDVPVQDYDTTGVGYQIFIASFRDGLKDDAFTEKGKGMGDLRGIIDALEEGYFDKLNVDVLWLTPFQSSTNYHGYDIKDYYSVDPRFGTIEDYRELLYKAHRKGIKIVMDFVLNHTAENNPWYVKSVNLETEVKDGKTIEYRNFYNWITKAQYDTISGEPNEFNKDGSANPKYNPVKAQWFEDAHGYYFYSSFGSSMPELNYDYQPVRDAILDVCNYWMAFGLDGFRCDAVKHIYMKNETEFAEGGAGDVRDASNAAYAYDMTRNMNFWREFNYKLKTNYPNAFLVGENLDGNPYNVGPFFEGMDSQFNFHGYYEAGHAFAAAGGGALTYQTMNPDPGYATWSGGAIGSYKKELEGETYTDNGVFYDVKGYKYYNSHYIDGRYTSNHDLPRARDLMNMQTHGNDELWRSFFNDAEQDRSKNPAKSANSGMVTMTDTLLRLYYAFNMTLPGVSWIYYGDELGMTGNMNTRLTGDKEGAHEDRIYRQPMKWYDDMNKNASFDIGFETFRCELVGLNATTNVKGVDGQDKDADSLLNWMRKLTKVRNDHPELINGTPSFQGSSNGLSEYTLTGSTGKTKVYISTNGSVASKASGSNVYATWTSGNYSVMICKG